MEENRNKYNFLDLIKYKKCAEFFERQRYQLKRSWVQIKYCDKKITVESEENDQLFSEKKFAEINDDNDLNLSCADEWFEFVKYEKYVEDNCLPTIIPQHSSQQGTFDLEVPSSPLSAWQSYKNKLEKKHLSSYEIRNIEQSAHSILNYLNLGEKTDTNKNVVKGMVVGNVQSGKTSNMEAVITMAADYGCNLVIVLTGLIDNLRDQTETRFRKDLSEKNYGNIKWATLPNPCAESEKDIYNLWKGNYQPSTKDDVSMRENIKTTYLCFCLKNSKRLLYLSKLLNDDPIKKKDSRIIIIDDEADQASLNTKNISKDEKTKINHYIRCIVNNWKINEKDLNSKENYDTPYGAMNYIGYTATPYGNFLNDGSEDSLYPDSFISLLSPSDYYFGPKQIFGIDGDDKYTGLPIINSIYTKPESESDSESLDELDQMKQICRLESKELPNSLKDALIWFCCATAVRRVFGHKGPSSMLIHHSMITDDHNAISQAVYSWLLKLKDEKKSYIELCRKVYTKLTSSFTYEYFKENCNWYGKSSNKGISTDINDYPDFKQLETHLYDLIDKIGHIYLSDEQKLEFNSGLHLCIDNSNPEAVTEDDLTSSVRLQYPDDDKYKYDGLSPAFIVIGGNTLSRGLTIEGLLSTYFSRDVKQADTLMQMGRWFGYRIGYELLPRIWMTDLAFDKFLALAEIDENLRMDLVKYASSDEDRITPKDVAPIITHPAEKIINITAKNKSQGAVLVDFNLAGKHKQTTIFRTDSLQRNLDLANSLIDYLEVTADPINYTDALKKNRRGWKGVSFSEIWNRFIRDADFTLLGGIGNNEILKNWVEKVTADNNLGDWNVVILGNKTSEFEQDEKWRGINKVTRTRKISGTRRINDREFDIGVLADPDDWKSDFEDQCSCKKGSDESISDVNKEFSDDTKNKVEIECKRAKERASQGLGNIPLLVIYCIDHRSKVHKKLNESQSNKDGSFRENLNSKVDVIGIHIFLPGDVTQSKYRKKISLSFN